VLAVVAAVARQQLHSLAGSGATGAAGRATVGAADARSAVASDPAPAAVTGDAGGATMRQEVRSLQEQVRADTARALRQGAERTESADR
jgi:hypothetical protein